ncbi:MAG: aldo/keto reductase [Pseudomonadota bacterium]
MATSAIPPPPSRLGYGCSGVWAERYFSEKKAINLVRTAIDVGVRVFDTAGFYADGEAERRLGVALKGVEPEQVVISTKTGTRQGRAGRKVKDFSAAAIREDIDASRFRLGRDNLDILLLHGPSPTDIASCLETLQTVKEEGKVRAIGVCGAGPELSAAVETGCFDVLMCAYNVIDRTRGSVIANAKAAGMTVMGIAPLAQGLYNKNLFAPRTLADVWYLARALAKNRPALAAARRLTALHDTPGWAAAELALAYTLSNGHIDCAMTTTSRPAHIRANAAVLEREPPARALAALDAAGRRA